MNSMAKAFVLGAAGLLTASANAATLVSTLNGSASGRDGSGLFGSAGSQLQDVAFTLTYTLTFDDGSFSLSAWSNGVDQAMSTAGSDFSPTSYGEITINGVSSRVFASEGIMRSFLRTKSGSTDTSASEEQVYDADGAYIYTYVAGAGDLFGAADSVKNLDASRDSFDFAAGRDAAIVRMGEFVRGGTALNLDIRSVQSGLAEPAAVPEPATWAMMIGGLGLAGGMMRRRATRVRYAA